MTCFIDQNSNLESETECKQNRRVREERGKMVRLISNELDGMALLSEQQNGEKKCIFAAMTPVIFTIIAMFYHQLFGRCAHLMAVVSVCAFGMVEVVSKVSFGVDLLSESN